MDGTDNVDAALDSFISKLEPSAAVNVRSTVHAWQSGGGTAVIGKIAARLVAPATSFTAATIRQPRGESKFPTLELSRVLLEQHGVDWIHWSDEFADLHHHGFQPTVRFPTIGLDERITPAEMARLVTGLRDLAGLVQ